MIPLIRHNKSEINCYFLFYMYEVNLIGSSTIGTTEPRTRPKICVVTSSFPNISVVCVWVCVCVYIYIYIHTKIYKNWWNKGDIVSYTSLSSVPIYFSHSLMYSLLFSHLIFRTFFYFFIFSSFPSSLSLSRILSLFVDAYFVSSFSFSLLFCLMTLLPLDSDTILSQLLSLACRSFRSVCPLREAALLQAIVTAPLSCTG